MENNNNEDVIGELIEKSVEAKTHSHSPYSNFRVGAALLTVDGHIIQGCNIENASYTLGVCAERCAIFKAVSDGHRNFTAIAISTDLKDDFAFPCGACRQILYEFAKDADVYLVKPDLTHRKTDMKTLLPYGFDAEFLGKPLVIPTGVAVNGN